jgi:hypothetical protein
MAIGLMGIYETYFAAEEEDEPELKLAMAGEATGVMPSVHGPGYYPDPARVWVSMAVGVCADICITG